MTTKITSFPSLHLDQGHGLTKVRSQQEKQQVTKQNKNKTKEAFNASESIRERRGEEGGLLEEGVTSAEPDVIAGIDAQS